jgi:hypothetical protein
MGDWSIHPPRPSKEEPWEIAHAEQAHHRHKRNKAAGCTAHSRRSRTSRCQGVDGGARRPGRSSGSDRSGMR